MCACVCEICLKKGPHHKREVKTSSFESENRREAIWISVCVRTSVWKSSVLWSVSSFLVGQFINISLILLLSVLFVFASFLFLVDQKVWASFWAVVAINCLSIFSFSSASYMLLVSVVKRRVGQSQSNMQFTESSAQHVNLWRTKNCFSKDRKPLKW